MKIQLGSTAKRHKGTLRKVHTHQGGVTLRLMQRVDRDVTHSNARKVIYKEISVELDLDEAEKLAHDLLRAAEHERSRQCKEKLAARGERDHCCIHCGHEWTGKPDELCPKRTTGNHPSGPHTLTDAEIHVLGPNGLSWIEGPHGDDWFRIAAYDRDVLNSLHHRGLIEWVDNQTNWRLTSVGVFVVQKEQREHDAARKETTDG